MRKGNPSVALSLVRILEQALEAISSNCIVTGTNRVQVQSQGRISIRHEL